MCLFPRPLSVAEDREFDFGNERETSDVHDLAGDGWANETYGCGGFKPRFDGACINSGRYRKVYSKLRIEIAAGAVESLARSFPDRRLMMSVNFDPIPSWLKVSPY